MAQDEIRPGMRVLGADGGAVGHVDRLEDDRLKLRRNDPKAGGEHHWIPAGLIAGVEGDAVRLTLPAAEVAKVWQGETAMQSPLDADAPAGISDPNTGTGGQSMVHDPSTFGTVAGGEPGPRPDTSGPAAPSRDKDRDMRS
ncbi:MAG TPA: DUF2171 domain-containing protein [Crenalkalicoccus sp.]|nr:DUF2171 domain-containing protein [Crenalkalicoccus sp.]